MGRLLTPSLSTSFFYKAYLNENKRMSNNSDTVKIAIRKDKERIVLTIEDNTHTLSLDDASLLQELLGELLIETITYDVRD